MNDSPFGFERPEDSPGYLLWKTMTLWQKRIKKALEPSKITHAQFVLMAATMWYMERQQNPSQVMLIEMSGLDKMTVSQSLTKLSEIGYIERVEDPRDTRVKLVRLSDQGRKLITNLIPLVEGVDEDFFSPLNDYEQRNLVRMLYEIVKKA